MRKARKVQGRKRRKGLKKNFFLFLSGWKKKHEQCLLLLFIAVIPQGSGIVCFLKSLLLTGSSCLDAQGGCPRFADVPLASSLEITELQVNIDICIILVSKYRFDLEGPFCRERLPKLAFPSSNRKAFK